MCVTNLLRSITYPVLKFIIDRNITIAIYMADECYNQVPEQRRDRFNPREPLLYSENSSKLPNHPLVGSATRVRHKHRQSDHETKSGSTPRMVPLRHRGCMDSSPCSGNSGTTSSYWREWEHSPDIDLDKVSYLSG